MRLLCLLSICLSLVLCGCQSIRSTANPSPFAYELVRGQLVIHSDFPLSERHRLVDDLASQRDVLSEKLALLATDEPIHIYLFSDDRAYHEFLERRFPSFSGRRAIFVETDIELAIYAHWGDHVAEDLRHEVSHGYLHAAIPNLPLWLDEGLAEYFEVGRGQRGMNRAHIDHLVAKIELDGWKPDILRLEQLDVAADMTQEDYAEAWAWVHFLLESDDDKSALLIGYLSELRQNGVADALSTRISKRLAGPELALVEHLQSLR